MKTRPYLILSGALFVVVALGHLVRIVNGWDLTIGSWAVPAWISWLATILPALLAAWAFYLASCGGRR